MNDRHVVEREGGAGETPGWDAESETFVKRFEECSLEEFHHPDHVRLAWLYLRRFPTEEALSRFSRGLRRFAASKGASGKYHETITWAYLLLIRQRMEESVRGHDWEGFRQLNPDLLNWQPSVLERFYRAETLASDLARRVFVLPDRLEEMSNGSGSSA